MSGKASGSDANGSAQHRSHNQGNQDRSYTVEQKAAVIRVRKCSPTAFYEILGLESVKTSCSESDIKKAYRKLSLLTHPDKNGHEHADEAFKMVSRAFGVLSDKDKRNMFDRTGGDPDSRSGGGGPPASSPFAGGGGGFGGRRGWDDGGGMSAEEMFNQFFGGGGMGGGGFGPFGGGGGMFDTGPQFVFNLGGGPGIRVHQFGGNRPRARPRDPNQPQQPQSLWSTIAGLLPLLVLFVIPLLSSIFSGSNSTSAGPHFKFDSPSPPYTLHRLTPNHKINYYVNPSDVHDYTARKFSQLDKRAEVAYVQGLRIQCENEMERRQQEYDAAFGWFIQDRVKAEKAKNMELPSCNKLGDMNLLTRQY